MSDAPARVVLDLESMALALAANAGLRARLCAEYGLPKPAFGDDFVASLVEAFDQEPLDNPVDVDRSPRDVFRPAVRSLGATAARGRASCAASASSNIPRIS